MSLTPKCKLEVVYSISNLVVIVTDETIQDGLKSWLQEILIPVPFKAKL
jgi:hypothetical protein